MIPPDIRLDRLGRSFKDLPETVEDLEGREINLISLEERTDTTSAAGELVFHVLGAIAQFECQLISQRTKDGLATARKHGRNPGRLAIATRNNLSPAKSRRGRKLISQAAKHFGVERSTAYKVISEANQRQMFVESFCLT